MAITRVKTWTTTDCRFLAAAASNTNQAKLSLWNVKEILKTLGWTVAGSSDGTTADSMTIGVHGTDKWTVPSKCVLVNGSGAHAWIVIENPSFYSHFQLCFDLISNASLEMLNIYCSPSGQYSGGSTTAKPTATDEITLATGGYVQHAASTAGHDSWLAGAISSDGQCTRIFKFATAAGTLSTAGAAILFDRVQNAPSWWTEKYVMPKIFGSDNNFTRAKFAAASDLKAMINTTTPANIRDVRATCEATAAGFLPGLVATDYGGTPVVSPVGLCIDSTTQRGWLGNLYDAYWIDTNMPNASPLLGAGGAWDWIKWGDAIFGWNGSRPTWVSYSYS